MRGACFHRFWFSTIGRIAFDRVTTLEQFAATAFATTQNRIRVVHAFDGIGRDIIGRANAIEFIIQAGAANHMSRNDQAVSAGGVHCSGRFALESRLDRTFNS